MPLQLQWRRFRFLLQQPLRTAAGVIEDREGWLLRIEASDGALGWGEGAPLDPAERSPCAAGLQQLTGQLLHRSQLEQRLPRLSPALGFGVGAALADRGGWRRRGLPSCCRQVSGCCRNWSNCWNSGVVSGS